MKKIIVLLFFGLLMIACDKDNNMEQAKDVQLETRATQPDLPPQAKKDKVLMCHMGQSIYVPKNTVSLHLDHGDYLGPCEPCEYGIAELDQLCEILES